MRVLRGFGAHLELDLFDAGPGSQHAVAVHQPEAFRCLFFPGFGNVNLQCVLLVLQRLDPLVGLVGVPERGRAAGATNPKVRTGVQQRPIFAVTTVTVMMTPTPLSLATGPVTLTDNFANQLATAWEACLLSSLYTAARHTIT